MSLGKFHTCFAVDPYYRFFIFKSPLLMISWNALLACDAYDSLAPTIRPMARADIAKAHFERVKLAEKNVGYGNDQIPTYCYLSYTLADQSILPLGGRFGLKWYPVDRVEWHWNMDRERSYRFLQQVHEDIESKYRCTLALPPPPGEDIFKLQIT